MHCFVSNTLDVAIRCGSQWPILTLRAKNLVLVNQVFYHAPCLLTQTNNSFGLKYDKDIL